MDRDILHIYIPSFPIALARAGNPALRRRPVAVAPSHSERAPIHCASPEARSEGIFEGMPLFRARRLCPSLVVLPPDPAMLSGGTGALVRLTREYSPVWEPSAAGRLYLDLTGSRRLLGPGRDAALRLERELHRRLNLMGAVGVAGNKLVSRVAAGCLDKPGICDVLRGSEAGFIAPLPVSVLPGVGSVRERTLMADLNLRLVGEVAALTVGHLALAFGPFAPLLHNRARGVDPSPVVPPRRVPEVVEECDISAGENDDPLLLAELYRMAEGCGLRLRRLGRKAGTLALTVTYLDGLSARRTARIPAPSDNDQALFEEALDLFRRACGRRVRVRAMTLACGRLREGDGQLGLFDGAGGLSGSGSRAAPLQTALDAVRERYGPAAVMWGRTANRVQSAEGGRSPKSKVEG